DTANGGHIGRFLSDAPADLDDLIAGLLSPSPQRRPSEADVLGMLDDRRRSNNVPRPNPLHARLGVAPDAVVESGLKLALERIERRGPALLHVHGEERAATIETARRAI